MKIYKAIFYWLFELGENAPLKWASHWRAYTIINIFEIWTLFSLLYYVVGIFNIKFIFPIKQFTIPLILIYFFKTYFIFERDNKWIEYIKYFRNLPIKERRRSLRISIFIILLCVLNIIYSIYFLHISSINN